MNSIAVAHSPLLLADMGIPMIFISFPAMVVALIPVIVVEAFVLRRLLSLRTADAFRASAKANLVSTVVGIPLGWVAALLCEIVVGGASLTISSIPGLSKIALNGRVEDVLATIVTAPWISGEGEPWTVAFAHAILLVPFFFASVWIERRIVQRSLLWCAVAQDDVKRALRDANLVSYAGLLLFTLATLLYLAMRH